MIFIAAAAAAAFVSLVIDMIEHGAEEGWRGSKVGLFYSDRCLSCHLAPLLSQLVTTPPKNFNSLRALAKSSQGILMPWSSTWPAMAPGGVWWLSG
jgi:hypothetical protein